MIKHLMTAALLLPVFTHAAGPCPGMVITSRAEVSVSDGTSYQVETYYRSVEESVVSFKGPNASDIVSEGPYAWYRQGEKTGLAGETEKRFAIGHQYHAMLVAFDDIMVNVQPDPDITFRNESHSGHTGDYPFGGKISLIEGNQSRQPKGFLMLLPDETPIEVVLDDWRANEYGNSLPYQLTIFHGDRVFTYRYEQVDFDEGDAASFHQQFPAPGIGEITEFRAKQIALAIQCKDSP
ncbi:MAG TPA: hypothetical protein VJ984_07180 [Xanthomonadales bacterium]|nr:hypothetical protein [Xanthomonadales bacterium]